MKKLLTALLSATLLFTSIPAYNIYATKTSVYEKIDLTKQYEVSEVVDGDTIKVNKDGEKITVRLLQVDTPESKHPNKNKNVPMGKTATQFTINFLKNKKVRLETDVEPYDKYGRLLAYVYVKDDKGNEVCLNQALIENSLAKTVKYGKNTKNYEKYLAIERKLRDKKQGIWANIQANYPSNKPTAQEQKQKATANKKQISLYNSTNPYYKTWKKYSENSYIKEVNDDFVIYSPKSKQLSLIESGIENYSIFDDKGNFVVINDGTQIADGTYDLKTFNYMNFVINADKSNLDYDTMKFKFNYSLNKSPLVVDKEVYKKSENKSSKINTTVTTNTEIKNTDSNTSISDIEVDTTSISDGQGKIKGNINRKGEKIYHVPGGAYYDRTIAEEYFDTEQQAQAAGYRRSKR